MLTGGEDRHIDADVVAAVAEGGGSNLESARPARRDICLLAVAAAALRNWVTAAADHALSLPPKSPKAQGASKPARPV